MVNVNKLKLPPGTDGLCKYTVCLQAPHSRKTAFTNSIDWWHYENNFGKKILSVL